MPWNSPITGRGTSRTLEDEPLEIDGMNVLFDKRVTLFPVTLVEMPVSKPEPEPVRRPSNGPAH